MSMGQFVVVIVQASPQMRACKLVGVAGDVAQGNRLTFCKNDKLRETGMGWPGVVVVEKNYVNWCAWGGYSKMKLVCLVS